MNNGSADHRVAENGSDSTLGLSKFGAGLVVFVSRARAAPRRNLTSLLLRETQQAKSAVCRARIQLLIAQILCDVGSHRRIVDGVRILSFPVFYCARAYGLDDLHDLCARMKC